MNKFKKGDIIVWTGCKKDYGNYHSQFITLNKEYIVYDTSMIPNLDNTNSTQTITIIDDTNLLFEYNSKYFSTKIKYRNNKIDEILS